MFLLLCPVSPPTHPAEVQTQGLVLVKQVLSTTGDQSVTYDTLCGRSMFTRLFFLVYKPLGSVTLVIWIAIIPAVYSECCQAQKKNSVNICGTIELTDCLTD